MTHRQPDRRQRSRGRRSSYADADRMRLTDWRSPRSRRAALSVRISPSRANCGRGVRRPEFYQDAQKADSAATRLPNAVQGHPAVFSPIFDVCHHRSDGIGSRCLQVVKAFAWLADEPHSVTQLLRQRDQSFCRSVQSRKYGLLSFRDPILSLSRFPVVACVLPHPELRFDVGSLRVLKNRLLLGNPVLFFPWVMINVFPHTDPAPCLKVSNGGSNYEVRIQGAV